MFPGFHPKFAMEKNSRVQNGKMTSFQDYFNEDFLLSSSLKPKSLSKSNNENFDTKAKKDISVQVADEKAIEPEAKRICLKPAAITPASLPQNNPIPAVPISKQSATSSANASVASTSSALLTLSPSSTSCQLNLPVAPSPSSQYLSDQILQVRIKLQIYQKEYAHFVECANRSSLQIQETLDELHKLLNSNFDIETVKGKAIIGEISSQNGNLEPSNDKYLTSNYPTPNYSTRSHTPALPVPIREPEIAIKSIKNRPRAFPRKPRCLIFNSIQPSFSNLMVTSSLDGSVQLWSKSEQRIMSSLYLPSYLHKPFFVEDLCWDRRPSGILALGICESPNAPVNENSNNRYSSRSEGQIAFLKFDNNDPTAAPKFIYSPLSPHERSISVIESWSSHKHSNSETSHFLTGGLDKIIFSWKMSRNGSSRDPDISVSELHRRHTSSVQAICYDTNTCDIWSGGADCRLVQWNGESNRLVNEFRWDSRISHLIKSKVHPNLILATVTSVSSQLRLFDSRINNIVHMFGTQETANLSRYVRPSWHPDGNLIANGTLSPVDSVGCINIWDIRKMASNSSDIKPVKVIKCEDRRLVRAEFSPDGNCLVGMSTDGFMTFVDLSTS